MPNQHVMSPTAPQAETVGMLAAARYATGRFNATAEDLRRSADLLHQYYAPKNEAFANGLRDGLYIASQARHAIEEPPHA